MLIVSIAGLYFNPRPREEGDGSCRLGGKYRDISIHALVKRATYMDQNAPDTYAISIHALVKRATRNGLALVTRNLISIHALVKRATTTT